MKNRLTHLTVIIATLMALTACTTAAAGNPTPDQTTSTQTGNPSSPDETQPTDDLPSDGAPKVENPIDAGRFEQSPCDVLTAAQADELRIGPEGTRADTDIGNGCTWHNSKTGGDLAIGFLTNYDQGLSSLYRAHNLGDFEYFEPIANLEGFPAVAWDSDDKKPVSDCTISVGLTDNLSMQSTTGLSRDNVGEVDPCEVAAMATGKMLVTMRAGT